MFGKKKPSDPSAEWTKTGSFVHKPSRGWLHSDNSLMEGGVCYAVKVSEVLKKNLLMLARREMFYKFKHAVVVINITLFVFSDSKVCFKMDFAVFKSPYLKYDRVTFY